MKLTWSHAVLNVRDLEKMLEFYGDVLGFTISDRGPLGPGAPEIVFMSNDPGEHHQIAMVPVREEEPKGESGNPLNHMAFRVESFDDVKTMHERLSALSVEMLPLSHGNTLSLYFDDPEGNGLEIFWDTPWHVQQPQGKVWKPALDEDAALAWVQENFSEEPGFEPQEASDAEFVNRRN
jgi:catechol-2,3-dioxygenase